MAAIESHNNIVLKDNSGPPNIIMSLTITTIMKNWLNKQDWNTYS